MKDKHPQVSTTVKYLKIISFRKRVIKLFPGSSLFEFLPVTMVKIYWWRKKIKRKYSTPCIHQFPVCPDNNQLIIYYHKVFYPRNEYWFQEVQNSYFTSNQTYNTILNPSFPNSKYKQEYIYVSEPWLFFRYCLCPESAPPPQQFQMNPQYNTCPQLISNISQSFIPQRYPIYPNNCCSYPYTPYQLKFHQNVGTTCEDLLKGPTQIPGAGKDLTMNSFY